MNASVMNPDNIKIWFFERALGDLLSVLREDEPAIFSADAVERMKGIPLAPWRAFKGEGLTENTLSSLMSVFGVAPGVVGMERSSAGSRLPGYDRKALEFAARLPRSAWRVHVIPQPVVEPGARRIRDLTPPKRRHPNLRKGIRTNGFVPYVVCDSAACYWNGFSVRLGDGSNLPMSGDTPEELISMTLSGDFGDPMKDVFLHQDRWRHIYNDLFVDRDPDVIAVQSLHRLDIRSQDPDRTRGTTEGPPIEDAMPAEASRPSVASHLVMPWTMFPGQRIERKQLHALFGGRRQGAIGPSSRTANIFLFTDPQTGQQHGYVDGWQSDQRFHYTGEGQRGDQQMKSGNAAVLHHQANGKALRLFRGSGGTIEYVDEFAVDTDQPFYTTDAPETGGGPVRTVIVFRLLPRTIVPVTSGEAIILPKSTIVDEVSVESQFTERMWIEPNREPYEAERREARLVLAFRDYLVQQGHRVIRLRILPVGEVKPILSDIYVPATGLLVEAKGSVDRCAIRMAIGQLMDYRRFVTNADCAVLLPERPRDDLLSLIRMSGVSVYWPSGNSFERVVP